MEKCDFLQNMRSDGFWYSLLKIMEYWKQT